MEELWGGVARLWPGTAPTEGPIPDAEPKGDAIVATEDGTACMRLLLAAVCAAAATLTAPPVATAAAVAEPNTLLSAIMLAVAPAEGPPNADKSALLCSIDGSCAAALTL